VFAQFWMQRSRVELAFTDDLPAAAEHVRQFAAWADEVGAPSIRAWAMMQRGRVRRWIDDPPDHRQAIADYRESVALARSVGDVHAEMGGLIVMTYDALISDSADAASTARAGLTRCFEMREWNAIWLIANAATEWLVGAGHLEAAAVILGHLEAHHPVWGQADRDTRDAMRARIERLHDADELMAHGADMSQTALATYLIDQF
jgi:hypothetical protein